MRLFTAIELIDAARSAIALTQEKAVAGLGGGGRFRRVKPEQMHVTLVFIGEVPEERAAAIAEVMAAAIPVAPFRLAFGGLGAFPARGAPRALYLDVIEGAREAIDLHARVADRLAGVGVPAEGRPFHPHLTLGRWRESRPSDRPRGTDRAVVAAIEVTGVTLFESRISSSGPTYTRLAVARLVCP